VSAETLPLDRRAAVAALLRDRGQMLVVTGLGSPTFDVFAAGDHDANFYLWGAMGGAALCGLGLALARPDRPVVVFTGDGEQLMGLGGLATIGVSAPANLSVIVLDNGHFGETGMQRSHSGYGVRLTAMAAAAGFATVNEIDDTAALDDVRATIGEVSGGPRFFLVRISTQEVPRALPVRDGVHIKNRFRLHLGLPVN
jgi:thiamine pyrophosphate-dependent acetolactate synthase large subunit-like protein